MNNKLHIRTAQINDAEELLAIYKPYIENTAITFEYDVPSIEEFANRIKTTLKKYPYIVAVWQMQMPVLRTLNMRINICITTVFAFTKNSVIKLSVFFINVHTNLISGTIWYGWKNLLPNTMLIRMILSPTLCWIVNRAIRYKYPRKVR